MSGEMLEEFARSLAGMPAVREPMAAGIYVHPLVAEKVRAALPRADDPGYGSELTAAFGSTGIAVHECQWLTTDQWLTVNRAGDVIAINGQPVTPRGVKTRP